MDYSDLDNSTVNETFFAVLEELYPLSDQQYHCKTISDLDYAKLGCLRCLSSATSGNEFIQEHALKTLEVYEVNHFFKALKSKRRLKNLISLNFLLQNYSKSHLTDIFNSCSELNNFDIYAGDGHYQHAACFDKPIEEKNERQDTFLDLICELII